MNEYGLDVNYFKEKLSLILRDIGYYKPEEMHRELLRLASVVEPSQAQQPAFPPRDLTKPAEQQGMFSKFHVQRVDGSSAKSGKHHGCRYWVLDLDHDKHAPAAMRGYAEDCKETHPILSAEILAEFGMQSQAQQTDSRWMIPTESQILAATEKAGLWPNTVYTWLPAFHRYHAELAKLPPAPEGE